MKNNDKHPPEKLASEPTATTELAIKNKTSTDATNKNQDIVDCSEFDIIKAKFISPEDASPEIIEIRNTVAYQIGNDQIRMPNGDYVLTSAQEYLRELNTDELEDLANSGDDQAKLTLANRWTQSYTNKITENTSKHSVIEPGMPGFEELMNSITLTINTDEYKEAKKWVMEAAKHGLVFPMFAEFKSALEQQENIYNLKIRFSDSDEEKVKYLEDMKEIEKEYYLFHRMVEYLFNKQDSIDFEDSHNLIYLSEEEKDKLIEPVNNEIIALEETIRENGAFLPHEIIDNYEKESNNEKPEPVKELLSLEQYGDYVRQLQELSILEANCK